MIVFAVCVQLCGIPDCDVTVSSQKSLALQLIIRAADVSNCSKPFGVSKQWFNRLTAEFFQQGAFSLSLISLPTPSFSSLSAVEAVLR